VKRITRNNFDKAAILRVHKMADDRKLRPAETFRLLFECMHALAMALATIENASLHSEITSRILRGEQP
jgi:hypothetical protein